MSYCRFSKFFNVLLIAMAISAVCGCKKPAENANNRMIDHTLVLPFTSFLDVPGITDDEIRAITAFQEQKRVFVYGMPMSTEAFPDENGEIGGFSARLCDWLSGFFGIPFRPERYELADLFTGLESGAVDFTGELRATEERRQIYYMTDPIAERTLKYFRLTGSQSFQQISSYRKPRYGFMEGATTANTVTSRLKGESVEEVFINNIANVYDMLKNEEIDAFFYSSPAEFRFDEYADVYSQDFFPLIFSPVSFSTQNPQLKPVVSVMQKVLENGGFGLMTRLYSIGGQDHRKNKFMVRLTEEEHTYIKNSGIIPVAAEYYNYPISFYNKYEKQWQGIFFDVLKEVEDLTGLTFTLINDERTEWPALFGLLESGQALLVSELIHSNEREGRFLWPAIPTMTDYYTLLSKSEARNITINEVVNVRVALPRDTAYADIFRSWFPDHTNTVVYEGVDEAFNAVARGSADMTISSQRRLLALTNYHELTGFKINLAFNYPSDSFIGFNVNEALLCSIFDKALNIIDVSNISEQWINRSYDYQGKLAREQRPWLLGAAMLFLCTLILLFILFQKKRTEGGKLEDLVRRRTEAIGKQISLMGVVSEAAVLLLESDAENYSEALNKSMEMICRNVKADRVFLWQNFKKDDGKLYCREVCKWTVEETESEKQVSEKQVSWAEYDEYSYDAVLPNWGEELSMGNTPNGPLKLFWEPEFSFFSSFNLKSIVAVPLFINNNFWGAASFYDCHMERVFTEAEKHALQTWGLLAMGMIQRGKIAKGMRQALVESVALQGDLKIAMDAANAASRSKSAFLANMSHEIRTPMNSIMGFSELALDGEASPKTRDYLGKIKSNTEWLLQIINDILDISKIESGKMELEKIPFDMHELFSGCRTLIMPKANEKGVMLHFYAEPSIGKIPLGDPTRLRQVFVNLLSNAIKFTETGSVKFFSEIKEKTENSITLSFHVKDSGIGMTREQMDRIFIPFVQAESGTTRKYGGTGLGLPISKSIIEMMGGKLSVNSIPGAGSTFSFDLTLDTIDATDDDTFGEKNILNVIEKPAFKGEILLCEDNAMNQQVICEHLARVGLRTVVAGNGKIGLDMVKKRIESGEKLFDLIFMDMHMPVMDGLEASGEIIKLNTGIPIVAMTANIMAQDREMYRMSGMSDCVGKPFTSQELWHCLLKYFTPLGKEAAPSKDKSIEDDVDFQNELRVLFLESNRDKYDQIVKALEKGDVKLAHRLAHTLKSNAGQIGKTLLQKAAAEMEQKLSGGVNLATEEQLKTLETELNAAILQIEELVGESFPQENKNQPQLDKESMLELIKKLEPMIEMGNPECKNMLDGLRQIPRAAEFVSRIDDYDFEEAHASLAELKNFLLE